MNSRRFSLSLACLAIIGWSGIALAEKTNAFCEMRSGGETKKGQTGPCTITERDGKVSIELSNGVTHTLTPTNQKNHYRDQNGKKVIHIKTNKEEMFKWENRRLIVNREGGGHGGSKKGGKSGGGASR